jgi:hypothetical protein
MTLGGEKEQAKKEYTKYHKITDDSQLTTSDHVKITKMADGRYFYKQELRRSNKYSKRIDIILNERKKERADMLVKFGGKDKYDGVIKAKSRGKAYYNLLIANKSECISKILKYRKIDLLNYLEEDEKVFISHYTFDQSRRKEIDKIVKSINISILIEGRIKDYEDRSPIENILISAECSGKTEQISNDKGGWFSLLMTLDPKSNACKKVTVTINDKDYEPYSEKWRIHDQCNESWNVFLTKKSNKKPVKCTEKFSTEISSVKRDKCYKGFCKGDYS